MHRSLPKRPRRQVGALLRWLLLALLASVCVSALSNVGLPTRSQVIDRLGDAEKARLAELFHLRQTLGDAVWPGWGQAEIPVIVYNEAYAFLVGYPDPPPGWLKMPQRIARGAAWELVPDDTFDGQPYYRQRLADPNVTPEGFTVLVGERWVATFETKEYAQIDFIRGLRAQLPPIVRSVFPYRLAWRWLLGESEAYIGALAHETFHAFQGQVAPGRLALAEAATQQENRYPWDDRALGDAWQQEVNLLADAAQAGSDAEAAALTSSFLARRDARRAQSGLSPALVDYERQREWLEGLAKYAELALGRAAATTPAYQPVPAIAGDQDFKRYATRERFWSQQLDEVRRLSGRSGETRFYYTGAAQAALLDRLMPGWKAQFLSADIALEDLLRQAVAAYGGAGRAALSCAAGFPRLTGTLDPHYYALSHQPSLGHPVEASSQSGGTTRIPRHRGDEVRSTASNCVDASVDHLHAGAFCGLPGRYGDRRFGVAASKSEKAVQAAPAGPPAPDSQRPSARYALARKDA